MSRMKRPNGGCIGYHNNPLGTVLSRVPFDVWNRIFTIVIARGIGCYRLICRLRETLMQVCRFWRAVVADSSEFWTQINVRPCTSLDFIQQQLVFSGSRKITVRLDMTEPRPGDKTHDADAVIRLIQAYYSRIHNLTAVFGPDASFRCFQQTLLFTPLPSLRVLNVDRRCPTITQDPCPRICSWSSGASLVTSLRLKSTALDWTQFADFTSLRILVLRDLTLDNRPTWAEFTSIFVSASQLDKLCVRNVGCREIPPVRHRMPELAALTELDVSFGAELEFGLVLAKMTLPRLKILKYTGHTNEEAEAMGQCGSVLSTVTKFIFEGDFDERDLMMRIFLHMPSAVSIELLSSEYAVLEALLAADRYLSDRSDQPRVACPRMTTIAVRNLARGLVASFISRRAARGGRLAKVIFREGLPFSCVYEGNVITLKSGIYATYYERYNEPRWIYRDQV